MPLYCAAYNCKGYLTKGCGLSFHRFPKNPEMRQLWADATKRKNFKPSDFTVLCGKHFKDSDYEIGGIIRKLKREAVPSVFELPPNPQVCTSGKPRSRKALIFHEFTESAPKKRKRCRRSKKISHTQELKQSNYTTCCAPTCNNTSETHVLTRLPLDSERRQQWLSRINREAWTTCKNSALCQIHFAADAWVENAIGEKVLKDDVLPSMNLHGDVIMSCDNSSNFSEVRISADEAKNEGSVSSTYIKEEPLEPDIEMTDDDGIKQPFEAVYLNSNFAKCGDELIEISNIKVEEPNEFQEETELSESEPSDFIDKQQQDTITLSCLECNQYFDEKQDLDLHLQEKHSEKECTTEKQDNSPCKLIESMKMLVQKKLKVCDPVLQIASPNLNVTLASTTTCCSSTSTRS